MPALCDRVAAAATLGAPMRPRLSLLAFAFAFLAAGAFAAVAPAPERRSGEGEGPYGELILRGVVIVDGTGAPPYGPADVVIRGNRIASIVSVGAPGTPIPASSRPRLAKGGKEIDLGGQYLLPGFIDMHGHIGGNEQGTPAEYVYKLWLGHGITSIRDPGCLNGLDFCASESARSAANGIVAPRIFPYAVLGLGEEAEIATPEQARAWVRMAKAKGMLGMKCFGAKPEILAAAFDELKAQGMRSACHLAQTDVARVNALTATRLGLTTLEHWYGLPESLLDKTSVQAFPPDYNYFDESQRFGEAGRLWAQAAEKGSPRYEAVMKELLERGLTLDPTFGIYSAGRDLMHARRADWHDEYTLPSLWNFFSPDRNRHGSFFYDWGTEQEVAWRDNYRRWMSFVNDYKNRGGRVTVGSDSGFIYQVYGFGTIQEMEMLREAGFTPLEVIRSATMNGAEALGRADELGTIETGKLADLVVVAENPLANLKLLYGTGHIRLGQDGVARRVGGVRLTIKDGIVYDAAELRAQVRAMVAKEKKKAGIERLAQPGDAP
jgi:imidazolonepropionase-like amidohydrolase